VLLLLLLILILLLILLLHQVPPPPGLLNADLFCSVPDNVLLLLGLLRPEPEGVDDLHVRYSTLQALGGLLAAAPQRLQVRRADSMHST
jgi:hypothetical protein